MPFHLLNSGNTQVPAYLALVQRGYSVRRERAADEHGNEWWVAQGALGRFGAEDTVSLLGIVALAETRGENWPAPDDAIDRFMEQFYPTPEQPRP